MKQVTEEPIVQERVVDIEDAPPSPGTLLSEAENRLMHAVENDDVEQVKRVISEYEVIDLNCINSLGQTPLHIAVDKESYAMMRLLLVNGAHIGDSLVQAVSRESVECVRLLLEFEENMTSRSKERRSSSLVSQKKGSNINTDPLVLAAQKDSYDIVKLLLSKGYTIDDKKLHPRACDCDECELKEKLGCSLQRLNVYRALASPVYLSLSYLLQPVKPSLQSNSTKQSETSPSRDPILEALVLNKKLQELSNIEYEFKDEYLKLSEQCEDFAVSLLNQCRNMTEIKEFMSIPGVKEMKHIKVRGYNSQAKALSVLNFAIKNNNKKFVAHTYSQMMLNSVIYKGFRQWESYGSALKALFAFGYTLALPLWAMMYICCPLRISRMLNVPILKLIGHTGSFCLFLLLLTLSSVQDVFFDPLRASFLDYLLILWITGQFFQEAKECYIQGKERYFSQWWNIVTILMLLLFFVSGILWIAGYALAVTEEGSWAISFRQVLGVNAEKYKSYRLILLSNSCFAIAYLLAFLHISNTLQVNAVMGPLQLSLVKMIRDVLKFLFLFLLIYFAFTLALRKVYSQYVWARKTFLNQTSSLPHGFSSVYGSMRLTFWAVFDKTDLSEFKTDSSFPTKITENTGEVIFALFNITIILVAVNMLIAMMTNSFQSVENNSDIHWKFSRTHMWMQFIDKGSTLPPPFNILPTPEDIAYLFRRSKTCPCCRALQCTRLDKFEMDLKRSNRGFESHDVMDRDQVIKHLIQRHFYDLEKDRSGTEGNPKKVQVETQHFNLLSHLHVIISTLEKNSKEGKFLPSLKNEIDDIVKLWKDYEIQCSNNEGKQNCHDHFNKWMREDLNSNNGTQF